MMNCDRPRTTSLLITPRQFKIRVVSDQRLRTLDEHRYERDVYFLSLIKYNRYIEDNFTFLVQPIEPVERREIKKV